MDNVVTGGPSRLSQPRVTQPDYQQWARRDHWSVSDAAKLLCGRDPHSKIPGPQVYNRTIRAIDIIDRAFAATQEGSLKLARNAVLPIHALVEPSAFLVWARDQGLTVPDELVDLLTIGHRPQRSGLSARLEERVEAIARTLWIVDPALSASDVAAHPAMAALVPDSLLAPSEKLRLVESYK